MPKVYRERDANPTALEGSRIAVLGYGNLGRALAWNLRDHGQSIVVGNIEDDYGFQARVDGFPILSLSEAAQVGDIKLMLLPDELLPEVYLNHIAPSLKPGHTLLFASGYTVAFGFIEPPPFVDVVLLAPRTIGSATREGYQS